LGPLVRAGRLREAGRITLEWVIYELFPRAGNPVHPCLPGLLAELRQPPKVD
jgi:hypothetical protein